LVHRVSTPNGANLVHNDPEDTEAPERPRKNLKKHMCVEQTPPFEERSVTEDTEDTDDLEDTEDTEDSEDLEGIEETHVAWG